MFYLLPWEIDPDQPRIRVGAVCRFRHYTNLSRCEGRLRRLLNEFPSRPVVDVLRDLEAPPDQALSSFAAA